MTWMHYAVVVASAGWLAAAVGLYRMEAADMFNYGISDHFGDLALQEQRQFQAPQRLREAFRSPAHRLDRGLVIMGACVFAGTLGILFVFAYLGSGSALNA